MPVSRQIHPVLWDLQLICLRGWPFFQMAVPFVSGEGLSFQVWCSRILQCRLGIPDFNLPLFQKNKHSAWPQKGAFQPQHKCSACLSTCGKALSKIMSKCSQHDVIPGFHPSIVPVALFFRMNFVLRSNCKKRGGDLDDDMNFEQLYLVCVSLAKLFL